MNPQEIKSRTETLVDACMKVARLIPQGDQLSELIRMELIRRASDLGVLGRSLSQPQVVRYFGDRLNKSVDHVNGCGFWLEMIIKENWMDSNILQSLVEECDNLAKIYTLSVKNVEGKRVE